MAKIHARVTVEAEVSDYEAGILAAEARGMLQDKDRGALGALLERIVKGSLRDGVDAGPLYEAGYIPGDWIMADLGVAEGPVGDVDL